MTLTLTLGAKIVDSTLAALRHSLIIIIIILFVHKKQFHKNMTTGTNGNGTDKASLAPTVAPNKERKKERKKTTVAKPVDV